MINLFVNTQEFDLRSEPRIAPDTRIGTVYLCQKLENVKEVSAEGWVSCVTRINGNKVEGFAPTEYLRTPLSKNREKLVESVHREWLRFALGEGKEHQEPYYKYVGEMWQAIGRDFDGKDRDEPWSAAAISFMVRNAGPAYKNFRFSAGHSKFVHHAINARLDKNKKVPFWGYRLCEMRPEVGDIICRDNPKYPPAVDFEIARNRDSYRSHTDVIMKIDSANNKIVAIGGNVDHSVHIAEYDLTHDGFANNTKHAFALLKNITDL